MSIQNRFNIWTFGQQIASGDMQQISETVQDLIGFSLATALGVSSCNSPANPLTVTISGATIVVGAGSPVFLLAGRLVEEVDSSTVLTPGPATLGRIDLIEAQLTEAQGPSFTRLVQSIVNGEPVQTTETLFTMVLTCTFKLKVGVDSGSPTAPAPDAGWTGVGTVTMPASGGNPSAVAITLPMAPQLDASGGLIPSGGKAGYYSGVGAPTITAHSGSHYVRSDGTTGSRWYVNTAAANTSGATWAAVSGV